MFRKGLEVCY